MVEILNKIMRTNCILKAFLMKLLQKGQSTDCQAANQMLWTDKNMSLFGMCGIVFCFFFLQATNYASVVSR